ncbi:MAG: hypothetical protein RBU21_15625 [FCB group bacterium]|jgi:hypothetical protein|nr:hypothetical protein [FCB group bacterium]
MKHVNTLTKNVPAKALANDHPSLIDSISAFVKDPAGTVGLHLNKGVE